LETDTAIESNFLTSLISYIFLKIIPLSRKIQRKARYVKAPENIKRNTREFMLEQI